MDIMRHTRQVLFLFIVSLLSAVVFMGGTPGYAAPHRTPTVQPPTNTPSATSTPSGSCYRPQSVTTQISGYTEGSTNKEKGIINGKETTYNLVTFQRENFSVKAQMTTSGRVLGDYVGYVQGFVANQNAPTDFKTFNDQYATQFDFDTEAANTPIWSGFDSLSGRQGTVHFSTSTTATPQPTVAVNGDQSYLVVSNPPFSVGESGQSGYFFINGSSKSYIVNCLVDIPTLVSDIQNGNGSVVRFKASVVSSWRNAAASAAQ